MKQYDQVFTLEINKTKEEITRLLERKGKVTTGDHTVMVNHNPPWYQLFAARGHITMNFSEDHAPTGSITECILSPSIADPRTITIFLLCNIPVWAALLYFYPWNIMLAPLFLIEWLMMAFIAIPLMFLAICIGTVYILSISTSGPSLYFLIIAWSFFILLINATLRYNRGGLKKWLLKTFI